VLVSCQRQSLKGIKDYCKLVVTPCDLLCALELAPLERYHWDIGLIDWPAVEARLQATAPDAKELQEKEGGQGQVELYAGRQLARREVFQTGHLFRERKWQGIARVEGGPAALEKGKRGLPSEYRPLEDK
jgi:hypothetical protein